MNLKEIKVLALCISFLRVCLSTICQFLRFSPRKQKKLVNDKHLDRLFSPLSPQPVKEE